MSSSGDHSSIFELFKRLNTGGTNLHPQELRMSLYDSPFYKLLRTLNIDKRWRRILGSKDPDLRLRDVQVLLRSFAMLADNVNYAPSMLKFLNRFSVKCQNQEAERNIYLQKIFDSFLKACEELPQNAFRYRTNNRFDIALFEAVFVATCKRAFAAKELVENCVSAEGLQRLAEDTEFREASRIHSTTTHNVQKRLERSQAILDSV